MALFNKKTNILVIGNGGREHAIIAKLRTSFKVGKIYALNGNGGIANLAECVSGISITDVTAVVNFVKSKPDIGLTVVAPDDPLACGLVDALNAEGLRAFGPTKSAARLESSKVFSKTLMKKYNIPSADFNSFISYEDAIKYTSKAKHPLVVKADGLALGKGVIICQNTLESEKALKQIMLDKSFGAAGEAVVVEEFLLGREVSVLAFCDGKTIVPMLSACDHKRALDNDLGLNTGGMGTFAPCPWFSGAMQQKALDTIIKPTLNAINCEGITYKGIIYFGLMVNGDDIKVLEYNARFGDPETQVILPLLKTDLFKIFNACINGTLHKTKIKWHNKSAAVCVMLASGGYPQEYKKGYKIKIGELDRDIILYHSGTSIDSDGDFITNGGRVLGVVSVGNTLLDARTKVYDNIKRIDFTDMHYRKDICKQ